MMDDSYSFPGTTRSTTPNPEATEHPTGSYGSQGYGPINPTSRLFTTTAQGVRGPGSIQVEHIGELQDYEGPEQTTVCALTSFWALLVSLAATWYTF